MLGTGKGNALCMVLHTNIWTRLQTQLLDPHSPLCGPKTPLRAPLVLFCNSRFATSIMSHFSGHSWNLKLRLNMHTDSNQQKGASFTQLRSSEVQVSKCSTLSWMSHMMTIAWIASSTQKYITISIFSWYSRTVQLVLDYRGWGFSWETQRRITLCRPGMKRDWGKSIRWHYEPKLCVHSSLLGHSPNSWFQVHQC